MLPRLQGGFKPHIPPLKLDGNFINDAYLQVQIIPVFYVNAQLIFVTVAQSLRGVSPGEYAPGYTVQQPGIEDQQCHQRIKEYLGYNAQPREEKRKQEQHHAARYKGEQPVGQEQVFPI